MRLQKVLYALILLTALVSVTFAGYSFLKNLSLRESISPSFKQVYVDVEGDDIIVLRISNPDSVPHRYYYYIGPGGEKVALSEVEVPPKRDFITRARISQLSISPGGKMVLLIFEDDKRRLVENTTYYIRPSVPLGKIKLEKLPQYTAAE